jgi:hypothetical protein
MSRKNPDRSVKISDRADTLSGKHLSVKKTAAFRNQNPGMRINPEQGYSSTETIDNNDLREINSQTPDEYNNARRDPNDKYAETEGEYDRMSAYDANELYFKGIDRRKKRAIFCDNLGKCFFIGAAALASAKALGLFGGKIQKTKRRKNKNRKTKRRR